MSDRPLFLSTRENCSDILPIEFRLMNGYVHRLFLSRKADDISITLTTDIPYTYQDGELIIDLRERNGNYSFFIEIESLSLGYHETYHVITEEKITLEQLCGRYQNGKNILSITDNKKGSLFFSRFLRKKTLYFDVIDLDPFTYDIKTSVFQEEEEDRKYFILMRYDPRRDTMELSLYLEEYSLDSTSKEVIQNAEFTRVREQG